MIPKLRNIPIYSQGRNSPPPSCLSLLTFIFIKYRQPFDQIFVQSLNISVNFMNEAIRNYKERPLLSFVLCSFSKGISSPQRKCIKHSEEPLARQTVPLWKWSVAGAYLQVPFSRTGPERPFSLENEQRNKKWITRRIRKKGCRGSGTKGPKRKEEFSVNGHLATIAEETNVLSNVLVGREAWSSHVLRCLHKWSGPEE